MDECHKIGLMGFAALHGDSPEPVIIISQIPIFDVSSIKSWNKIHDKAKERHANAEVKIDRNDLLFW